MYVHLTSAAAPLLTAALTGHLRGTMLMEVDSAAKLTAGALLGGAALTLADTALTLAGTALTLAHAGALTLAAAGALTLAGTALTLAHAGARILGQGT
jgi:acyl-coenzyme A thioesterase PaaI-like protein